MDGRWRPLAQRTETPVARRKDKEDSVVLQVEVTHRECPLEVMFSPLRTPICKHPRTRCPCVLSLPAEPGFAWSCSCGEGTSQPDGDTHPGADVTHAGLAVAGRPTGAPAAICRAEISRPQSACSSLKTLLPQQCCPTLWTEDRTRPCAGEWGRGAWHGHIKAGRGLCGRGLPGQALILLVTHSAQPGVRPNQPLSLFRLGNCT